MDHYVDERDYRLLENDRYTFFVLSRIMGGESQLLLTDHTRLIICFSCDPFPVWIWTADDANDDEKMKAYTLIKEHGLLDGKHQFNIKYDLAQFFMEQAKKEGREAKVITNLFAYDCPELIAPDAADGELYLCKTADTEELADFQKMFHDELQMDQQDREAYLRKATDLINGESVFFWKDANGSNVASCHYGENGDMASIGLVYTRPECRRKHYAENLVYQVAKLVREKGFMPMLYTDADYVASNACYEKIGFILRGKLCTLAVK